MTKHIDFSFLEQDLPRLIWRSRWNQLAAKHGLPFKKGYMQNLDSLGIGPAREVIRGRVVYRRKNLINWLNDFMSSQVSKTEPEKIRGWLDE